MGGIPALPGILPGVFGLRVALRPASGNSIRPSHLSRRNGVAGGGPRIPQRLQQVSVLPTDRHASQAPESNNPIVKETKVKSSSECVQADSTLPVKKILSIGSTVTYCWSRSLTVCQDQREIGWLFEPEFNIPVQSFLESFAFLPSSLITEKYTFLSRCARIHLQNCLRLRKLYQVCFLFEHTKQKTSHPGLYICFCLHFSQCCRRSYYFICWVWGRNFALHSLAQQMLKTGKNHNSFFFFFRFSWGKRRKLFKNSGRMGWSSDISL